MLTSKRPRVAPNNSVRSFPSTPAARWPCLSLSGFASAGFVAPSIQLLRQIPSIARLHFRNRSCGFDASKPDQGKNRARRPRSSNGFAHARGSAFACNGANLLVRLSSGRSDRLLPVSLSALNPLRWNGLKLRLRWPFCVSAGPSGVVARPRCRSPRHVAASPIAGAHVCWRWRPALCQRATGWPVT